MQTIPAQQLGVYSWQQQLRDAITDPRELIQQLQLPLNLLDGIAAAQASFSLRVPQAYLQRMRLGDPTDPLLLQVLPQAREMNPVPGYSHDPLGEAAANPLEGVIHKYQGRLLLIVSGGCAINCRYCFRRHFPYADNQLGGETWQRVLDYLRADSEVSEVILSGGDPLATTDKRLAEMLRDLEQIPHLQRLRIHTRLPVVIPDRVTPALTTLLAQTRLRTVLVTHINHPNELDDSVGDALQRLHQSGTLLLNQSVLLRGVNDDLSTLKTLSETLFAHQVLPYYLFLLDPVAGSAHFDLGVEESQQLAGQLAAQLPGYLVPQLVREQAGALAKVPLQPRIPGASQDTCRN
ncbi:MAG TPA: EF-P beta-lysylation protein EpmB [Motiliproteus sp.]